MKRLNPKVVAFSTVLPALFLAAHPASAACELFGGLLNKDPALTEKFNDFTASCIAAGQHPKTVKGGKETALFCCDNATDEPS